MKPTLALSTCWLSHRHSDGYLMAQEMRALGFTMVELSHGIRITLVPGILRAVQEGVVGVSSVHNFCPLPTGVTIAAPNLFLPTASDPREREQWLRQTRRTLDFAKQVGARVVVLHLGQIEFLWFNPARKLRRYLEEQPATFQANTPEYRKLVASVTARLRKRREPYHGRLMACLEQMLPYAEERGLRLGLENRERLEELPLEADFPELLQGLSKPGVAGYWHDTGHAQIKHRAGLLDHARHLEANAPALLGFHLHDVDANGYDHCPIGTGTVDFAMVARHFKPEQILVLELSPKVRPDDVLASRARLEAMIQDQPVD